MMSCAIWCCYCEKDQEVCIVASLCLIRSATEDTGGVVPFEEIEFRRFFDAELARVSRSYNEMEDKARTRLDQLQREEDLQVFAFLSFSNMQKRILTQSDGLIFTDHEMQHSFHASLVLLYRNLGLLHAFAIANSEVSRFIRKLH